MKDTSQTRLVSVVIPTKNSGKLLARCLASVRQQTYKQIELIVVDNHSSDETREIAKAFDSQVYLHGLERGAQKNLGAMRSTGAAIFFVDADMELSPAVVEESVEALRQYDALMIPEISVGEGFWNECVALERSCYIGDDHTEAARFYRREAFEGLGGFDETLVASGDDMDLNQRARRQGYKLGRINAHIIHQEGPRSPKSVLLKWRYYGRNMGKYINKNRRDAFFQYLPVRPAWVRHWRRLASAPLHTAGFMFLKLCQFCGVVLGQFEAWLRLGGQLSTDPYPAGQAKSDIVGR